MIQKQKYILIDLSFALKYVIKHTFKTHLRQKACMNIKYQLSLHRDFFIVLDLRLTKIGSKALLPFAFYRVYIQQHIK